MIQTQTIRDSCSGYTYVYPQIQGERPILPEAEVFLKARRLEFINLLNAVLDAGYLVAEFDFDNKHLNALTELELAGAISRLKYSLAYNRSTTK